jgi:hypothetical protein
MQRPVLVVELEASLSRVTAAERDRLIVSWYEIEPRLSELWYAPQGYVPLAGILVHPSLPVDVRHNSKINREELAAWAVEQLARQGVH